MRLAGSLQLAVTS